MSFVVVTGIAFIGGMVCGELDAPKHWVLFAAVTGLATGIAGRLLGVA